MGPVSLPAGAWRAGRREARQLRADMQNRCNNSQDSFTLDLTCGGSRPWLSDLKMKWNAYSEKRCTFRFQRFSFYKWVKRVKRTYPANLQMSVSWVGNLLLDIYPPTGTLKMFRKRQSSCCLCSLSTPSWCQAMATHLCEPQMEPGGKQNRSQQRYA